MPPTPLDDRDTSGEQPHQPTRLERELDEILAKADRPIPIQSRMRQRAKSAAARPRLPRQTTAWSAPASAPRWLGALPWILALGFAVLAAFVSEASPLFARVFVALCVGALIWPMVARWRRPQPPAAKMWRGRPIEPSRPESPLDDLRRRWRTFRRER